MVVEVVEFEVVLVIEVVRVRFIFSFILSLIDITNKRDIVSNSVIRTSFYICCKRNERNGETAKKKKKG
jgi:hypothetical protein